MDNTCLRCGRDGGTAGLRDGLCVVCQMAGPVTVPKAAQVKAYLMVGYVLSVEMFMLHQCQLVVSVIQKESRHEEDI